MGFHHVRSNKIETNKICEKKMCAHSRHYVLVQFHHSVCGFNQFWLVELYIARAFGAPPTTKLILENSPNTFQALIPLFSSRCKPTIRYAEYLPVYLNSFLTRSEQ